MTCRDSARQLAIERSELRKVLFLVLWLLCVWNIWGNAERICAKFTGKTYIWSLARKRLNVKVKGQTSRSPRTKTGFSADISGIVELICDKFTRRRRRLWSFAGTSLKVKINFGGLRAIYVWKNIFAHSSTWSILSTCITSCLFQPLDRILPFGHSTHVISLSDTERSYNNSYHCHHHIPLFTIIIVKALVTSTTCQR